MLAFEPDMPIISKCCQIWFLGGFWGRYPEAGTIIGRWGRKPVVQIHYRCLVQSPCHVRFPWDAEPEPVTLIGWDKLWVLESDTLIINQADAHRAGIMIQIPQLSQYWKFLQSLVVNLSPPVRLHDHTYFEIGDFCTELRKNLAVRLLYKHQSFKFSPSSFPQLLGCIVIGYMAWVLATSVTVARLVQTIINVSLYSKSYQSHQNSDQVCGRRDVLDLLSDRPWLQPFLLRPCRLGWRGQWVCLSDQVLWL